MREGSMVVARWSMALLLAVFLSSTAGGVSPDRCSLTPGFHPGQGVLMLAVPSNDTLRAGPGDLRQGQGAGHAGNGRRPDIYGQRFAAHRLGGQESAGLPSSGDVVLVPWDYDASCEPVPWSRSALWLKSSDTLLISVRRRDPAHWAGGIPTFDVTAVSQSIYAGKWWQARSVYISSQADSTTPVNTAAELFEFLTRLPSAKDVLTGNERVLDTINAWAMEHPEIATRAPAAARLNGVRKRLRTAQLMNQSIPFLGTWRLSIRLRSGREVIRWLRTASEAFTPWTAPPSNRALGASGPDGFKVQFNFAATEADLPTTYQYTPAGWGWTVVSRDPTIERYWKFKMQMEEFNAIRDDNPEVTTILGEYFQLWKQLWANDEEEGFTGEILRLSGDRYLLRIEWDSNGDSYPDLVVTGERVSPVSVPYSDPSPYQRW